VTSPDGDWVVVVVAGEGEFTCVAGGIATVARESSCASEPANASRDNEASRASGDVVPCSGEASSCVVDVHGATGVVGDIPGNAGPDESQVSVLHALGFQAGAHASAKETLARQRLAWSGQSPRQRSHAAAERRPACSFLSQRRRRSHAAPRSPRRSHAGAGLVINMNCSIWKINLNMAWGWQ
jgi:hypothetical protein